MATNNRPLKAYVRYDGSGRAVSSSLIWRKNKPKVGNWKEVQGYECCNPGGGLSDKIVTATLTIPEGAQTFIQVGISSADCIDSSVFLALTANITSYSELLNFLNTNYSSMGLFTYTAPETISLQLSSEGFIGQALSICPNAEWNLLIQINVI